MFFLFLCGHRNSLSVRSRRNWHDTKGLEEPPPRGLMASDSKPIFTMAEVQSYPMYLQGGWRHVCFFDSVCHVVHQCLRHGGFDSGFNRGLPGHL